MKFSKRLMVTLVLLAVLVVPSASAFGKQDKIELQITWWGSHTRHDQTIAVIELFEAANPNIDVVYEFSGWGDYWTLMTTKASGDNLPDVMQQDYAYMREWYSRDLLMPLDEYIADGTINLDDVPANLLESGQIDGKQYGISLGTNSQAVMIDVDLFEQAGVEMPSAQWTWADFEDTCMQIHEALDMWCFGGTLEDEALWKSLYIGYGDWVFADDGKSIGYEDDQPYVDFLNMILRLMDAGALPSEAEWAEYEDLGPENNPIVTGKSVMAYHWSNQVVAVANAAGEGRNFKLWPLPRPDGGQPQNYVKPSMFFAIPSTAKHAKEAAMFIDFFTNSVEANDIMMAERGIPISTTIRENLYAKVSPVQQEIFDFLALVTEDSSPVPPPDPAGWAEIRDNVFEIVFLDPVLYGEISPEEGAAYFREEANLILGRN